MKAKSARDAERKRREGRKPTVAQIREEMADDGDVEGLWALLSTTNWNLLDLPETFRLLQHAIRVGSHKNPRRFAAEMFERMVAATSNLMLRTQFYLQQIMSRSDMDPSNRGPGDLPWEIIDRLQPRLVELQRAVGELLVGQAHTARVWELVLEKKMNRVRTRKRTPKIVERPKIHGKVAGLLGVEPNGYKADFPFEFTRAETRIPVAAGRTDDALERSPAQGAGFVHVDHDEDESGLGASLCEPQDY